MRRHPHGDHGVVATVYGIPLALSISGYVVRITPYGIDPHHTDRDLHRQWEMSELRWHNPNPLGLGQAATNLVRGLRDLPAELAARGAEQRRRLAELDGRAGGAFPHSAELDQLRLQFTALQAELMATGQEPDRVQPPSRPAVTPTVGRPVRRGVGIDL